MVKELLVIDQSLMAAIEALQVATGVTFAGDVIARIIPDSESDQVSEKRYVLYESPSRLFKPGLSVIGIVDAYEPETIWIQIIGPKAMETRCETALAELFPESQKSRKA
jgi:hypothetical protein